MVICAAERRAFVSTMSDNLYNSRDNYVAMKINFIIAANLQVIVIVASLLL